MTVTYEPPLHRSSAQHGESLLREVIEEGPPYARGPRSTRWHRVRSGTRTIGEERSTGELRIREVYTLWCGQSMFQRPNGKYGGPILFADNPPTGEPACGTCEGRAIGADPRRPAWLFSPSRLDPPPKCPGTRTMLVLEDQGRYNRATCLVCRDVVKLGASGGPYNSRWSVRAHPPGPGLISGCPWHGWRELVIATTDAGEQVASCRCQTIRRDR